MICLECVVGDNTVDLGQPSLFLVLFNLRPGIVETTQSSILQNALWTRNYSHDKVPPFGIDIE